MLWPPAVDMTTTKSFIIWNKGHLDPTSRGRDGEGREGRHPRAVPRRPDHLPHQPVWKLHHRWSHG